MSVELNGKFIRLKLRYVRLLIREGGMREAFMVAKWSQIVKLFDLGVFNWAISAHRDAKTRLLGAKLGEKHD